MVIEEGIIKGQDDTGVSYFINIKTGVKLVLIVREHLGKLIEEEITEADIERAFQGDTIDIRPYKEMKPTKSEVHFFKMFIEECIKAGRLSEFRNIEIIK